ncbi:phage/plasmid replication domain-containing protein [Tepidibacter formicigenes]|uniref:Replication-associated protein G2P N-terminal domain-containing protein n=1 Tax=Tepidibacter formicigenes DSM 15518 TaxID=1123349 RepID=A0A1M6SZW7_9FIRM|nr:phage/plasmid replication protein [Tepidibacter formicigenes]SHK50251.1 hypothetical protein SAMN02744037_02471 [Tepidibacter formicigenes DSM 15518]
MIDTIMLTATVVADDINIIKTLFRPIVDNNNLYYIYQQDNINYTYIDKFNLLKIVINPSKLLGKDIVTDADYNAFVEIYKKHFYSIFNYTNYMEKLSRVDYKLDFVTEYKDLYLKLIKKSYSSYRHLKQNNVYETSLYYNSKSYILNIYDKEQEQEDKADINIIIDDRYENMLRFEAQLKRPRIYYNLKNWGLCDILPNYWSELDRDYYLNTVLRNIVFEGDYYNIYHSKKKLKEVYKDSTVKKLLELQKLISRYGITGAEQKYSYGKQTFKKHLNMLQDAGVNPVLGYGHDSCKKCNRE